MVLTALLNVGLAAKTGRQQASAAQRGTNASIAEQQRQFDVSQELTADRRALETDAGDQLRNILGIGGAPFDVSGVNLPGLDFATARGGQAIERSAAARGGLVSGNTADALQANAIGLGNQFFQNAFANQVNPLLSILGGNVVPQAGQNALNFGANIGNTLQQAGTNRANVIGQTGANVNNAINAGLENFLLLATLGGGGGGGGLPADPFSSGLGVR